MSIINKFKIIKIHFKSLDKLQDLDPNHFLINYMIPNLLFNKINHCKQIMNLKVFHKNLKEKCRFKKNKNKIKIKKNKHFIKIIVNKKHNNSI